MIDLPFIWAALLAFAIYAYVILDGFDLGVGILFPLFKTEEERNLSMNAIAPVWDGNETWLILGGGGLFAAFPKAYALVMPAIYTPIIVMLLGLIFRGVAFEFRYRDPDHRSLWDKGFFLGSLAATFSQGIVLGCFIQGINSADGIHYTGGWFDWLTPFTLITGAALVCGYALLGSTWLIYRTEGDLQSKMRKYTRPLGFGILIFMAFVSLWTPLLFEEVYDRWFSLPNLYYLAPIPLMVLWINGKLYKDLYSYRDHLPFLYTVGFFTLSFIGLGVSLYPYVVPRVMTIWEGASPDKSLMFMLVGALLMVPLILAYTGYAYWVFRGKVKPGESYH